MNKCKKRRWLISETSVEWIIKGFAVEYKTTNPVRTISAKNTITCVDQFQSKSMDQNN